MQYLRNVVCVRLLLAPKELILLLHLLHAQAGGSVLLRLTLRICGPVLNPGPLTENVLKPADAGDKSVATRSNQYGYNSGMWLPGNCGFAHSHRGIPKWNKLTFAPGHPCECLWTTPWGGRFFLWSGLKIPCSVDNWGMDAVFPVEPHRNFLKEKQHSLIHSFEPSPRTANVTVRKAATPAASCSLFLGLEGGRVSPKGLRIRTFLDDFQYPHCVYVSGQLRCKLFHSYFIHWGQTMHMVSSPVLIAELVPPYF